MQKVAKERLLPTFIEARKAGRVIPSSPITGSKIADAGTRAKWYYRPLSDVDVRAMVNFLRQEGHPIGSCIAGYWYALEAKELDECHASLLDRETAMRRAREGMMKSFNNDSRLPTENSDQSDPLA